VAIGTPVTLGTATTLFSSAATIVFNVTTTVNVGDDIFVAFGCQTAGTTITVADSTGANTYAVDVVANSTQNACFFLAHARCTSQLSSGGTITGTLSAARTERLACAVSVSGIDPGTPLDKTQTNNGSGVAVDAYDSTTTAATTQADELVIGGCCNNAAAAETQTATNGNTALYGVNNSDGVNLYMVYQIVAATGTYQASANLTDSGGRAWNAGVATYKASLAAPVVAWYSG
jgi:hypothetical protein